ncbi:hypothetical protein VCHSUH03_00535 [Veillonella infantium]|uniref:Knr4/Smi1-like domain-containing protein n=1 Tax=Veillonella infantium TaxID=1911679 RepID=A0ABX5C656_9FIRM|nr:SMI1/KNR4 family protein [Veillonella infantium]PQL58714.1 hypothetical protein VCHSUH03_00535 [Veillonella infantium]
MLNKFVLEQLIAFFQKNPVAQGKPTTDDEVLNVEKSLNIKLDDDFKEFTMRFGGVSLGMLKYMEYIIPNFLGKIQLLI